MKNGRLQRYEGAPRREGALRRLRQEARAPEEALLHYVLREAKHVRQKRHAQKETRPHARPRALHALSEAGARQTHVRHVRSGVIRRAPTAKTRILHAGVRYRS